ncbi:MAG: hypothetical protein KatS3mg077_2417 [Candidatus Binatia bacterium]|nr:MAG: hypothetical protein KatS3mg077_2417 [Candidatus Binatia bacterium]
MRNWAVPLLFTSLVALAGMGWYILELRAEIGRLQRQLQAAAPSVATGPRRGDSSKTGIQVTATAPASPRILTEEQRAAMIRALGGPNSSLANPVWFATVPDDPEAAAFQKQIQSAFEEAGWIVKGNAPVRFRMKPGIYIFAADEDPPAYVGTAQQALEDAGIEITQSGRGYREFYRQKKAENPNWVGFDFAEDQTYVVVIGRNSPRATPTP